VGTSRVRQRAPRYFVADPRETRDGLSVIPVGHRTYLKAKAGGESSMFGKAGCSETAKLHAGRGPDDKVKAGLLEPK